MPRTAEHRVRLELASRIDMVDVVQTVLVHLGGLAGFDEETCHYMGVAVRESVVNAIKHGNRLDHGKQVCVEFDLAPRELHVEVRDQGGGFDPSAVPDPLAPENLLKASGRGIFFMRQFMDEVTYRFPPRGGTVVRMVKKLPRNGAGGLEP